MKIKIGHIYKNSSGTDVLIVHISKRMRTQPIIGFLLDGKGHLRLSSYTLESNWLEGEVEKRGHPLLVSNRLKEMGRFWFSYRYLFSGREMGLDDIDISN